MLTKKIVQKGTSNFILIPKDLMNLLNLSLGDEVTLEIENGKIIISPKKQGGVNNEKSNNY